MHDDTTRPLHPHATNHDERDTEIDGLLPAPSAKGKPGHDDIDSEMDTSLPHRGEESHAADDATTREELEVDTTVDGVDDIVDPAPRADKHGDTPPRNHASTAEDGERGTTGPETIDRAAIHADIDDGTVDNGSHSTNHNTSNEYSTGDEEDHEPVNRDSGFFTASYRRIAAAKERVASRASSDATRMDSTTGSTITHQCDACGTSIGAVPYCPQCGTRQHPDTRLASLLSPLLSWSRPLAVRAVLFVSGVLVLLALLADSGANALMITAMTLPVVLLIRVSMQVQGYTSVGWIPISMMALVGVIAGLPLAWLAARLVKRSWFDTGVLNFGAAGLGGEFAKAAGTAPFLVWLVVGFLLPVVVLLGLGAAPAALRMVLNTPPAESTGMVLSSTVATGYLVASAVMFYLPLYSEMAPRMTTSQWTLTIVGLGIIRPLVWVLGGAMIGAVVWRFLRTANPTSVTMPATIAALIPLGFSVLSLASGPAGHWAETMVGILFATAAVYFYHRFLGTALRNDASLTGTPTPVN